MPTPQDTPPQPPSDLSDEARALLTQLYQVSLELMEARLELEGLKGRSHAIHPSMATL